MSVPPLPLSAPEPVQLEMLNVLAPPPPVRVAVSIELRESEGRPDRTSALLLSVKLLLLVATTVSLPPLPVMLPVWVQPETVNVLGPLPPIRLATRMLFNAIVVPERVSELFVTVSPPAALASTTLEVPLPLNVPFPVHGVAIPVPGLAILLVSYVAFGAPLRTTLLTEFPTNDIR